MSAHMDELIAQFSKFQSKIREAEARFEGVGDKQQQIAEIRHSVTSSDGTVTVVAGAVQQQAGIVDETFGDTFGLNTSERVREAQAEAFGAAEQDTPEQAPQQSSRPSRPRPDDDYFDDQGPILRR